MGLMDKMKSAMGKHPDKTKRITTKVADTADKKTGGSYSGQIRTGKDRLDDTYEDPHHPG